MFASAIFQLFYSDLDTTRPQQHITAPSERPSMELIEKTARTFSITLTFQERLALWLAKQIPNIHSPVQKKVIVVLATPYCLGFRTQDNEFVAYDAVLHVGASYGLSVCEPEVQGRYVRDVPRKYPRILFAIHDTTEERGGKYIDCIQKTLFGYKRCVIAYTNEAPLGVSVDTPILFQKHSCA